MISLDIDKCEWLEDIERGDSSSASFLACVEECISERESRRFGEELRWHGQTMFAKNNNVKMTFRGGGQDA